MCAHKFKKSPHFFNGSACRLSARADSLRMWATFYPYTHAILGLIVFPDSNWYISVVLLYVIVAGVRSNKR